MQLRGRAIYRKALGGAWDDAGPLNAASSFYGRHWAVTSVAMSYRNLSYSRGRSPPFNFQFRPAIRLSASKAYFVPGSLVEEGKYPPSYPHTSGDIFRLLVSIIPPRLPTCLDAVVCWSGGPARPSSVSG